MCPKVGKKELAAHLGWSRTRLDRELERNAAFPVAQRGDQAGGWLFDTDDVDGYLAVGAKINGAEPGLAAGAAAGCDTCRSVAAALKGIEGDVEACVAYLTGLQRYIGQCIHAIDDAQGGDNA